MKASHYRDMIVRAVVVKNDDLIDSIAAHLADCEAAKEVLRHKGYGLTGTPIDVMARMVPDNLFNK
jgi:hypothetical protein